VIRQFLAESVLLALLGCGAGLLLGHWALTGMLRLAPQAVPRLGEATFDAQVLGFALGASLFTGVLFGLAPATSLWKWDVHGVLKSESGASLAGAGRIRLRGLLAAAEMALAIVLLAGAGLMLKSFWRMSAAPPGFAPGNVLVMRVTLSGQRYESWPPKQAYTEELLERLQSLPGVEAAGVDCGSLNSKVRVDGAQPTSPEDGVFASIRGVSPGYLRAMGVPLVRGNWPARGSLFEVVVNEAFTRQIVRGESAGRHIGGSILNDAIAGVVADFKTWQLDRKPLPEVYMPYERMPVSRSMRVVVRTSGRAAAMAPAVRKLISSVDRTQPVYEFQTLDQALSDSIAPRRFNLFLLGLFAATALLLALVGIYGVIAHAVTQRTREIGIRLALGARRAEIVRLVVRQGMTLALAGIFAGVAAGVGLTRLMSSLLYDVKPNDPWIFAATSLALAVTALLASGWPALRAALVDPLTALRHE
jgi:putative ABC transport system permease protein